MSDVPDLSFLCSDPLYEPLAAKVVGAINGHPSLSTGAQLRLGLQLTLGALAEVDMTLRQELTEVLGPLMFEPPAAVQSAPTPPPARPARRVVPVGIATDLRSVRGMVMH